MVLDHVDIAAEIRTDGSDIPNYGSGLRSLQLTASSLRWHSLRRPRRSLPPGIMFWR